MKFGGSINGVDFALVGDSAFGVPFFRSINNGLRCGHVLSFLDLNGYILYVNEKSKNEVELSRKKMNCLDLFLTFTNVSNLVPWQVVKFEKKQLDDWTETSVL